jgi:hypothetical protein
VEHTAKTTGNRGIGQKALHRAQHSEQKNEGDDPRTVELVGLFRRLTDRQQRAVLRAVRRLARKRATRKDDPEHVSTDGNAGETIVERHREPKRQRKD